MSRYHITLKSNYDEPEADPEGNRSASTTTNGVAPAPPGTKQLPAPPNHEGRMGSFGTASNFEEEEYNEREGAKKGRDMGSEKGSYEEGYHTDPEEDEDDSDGEIVPS